MRDDEIDFANSEQPLSDAPSPYFWQYFAITLSQWCNPSPAVIGVTSTKPWAPRLIP